MQCPCYSVTTSATARQMVPCSTRGRRPFREQWPYFNICPLTSSYCWVLTGTDCGKQAPPVRAHRQAPSVQCHPRQPTSPFLTAPESIWLPTGLSLPELMVSLCDNLALHWGQCPTAAPGVVLVRMFANHMTEHPTPAGVGRMSNGSWQ